VERQGDQLRMSAPQLHFLEGKPLEQLHNGAAVTYVFSIALTADRGAPAFHLQVRFIVSYDLWEERFSIVQAGPPGRTGSHLTPAMAEAWCLESMPVPVPALPAGKTFIAKLECSVADEAGSSGENPPGLTLAGLIDVFSRKRHEAPPRWEAVSGPLRLADLKDKKN